jgi:hypothetical protein
MAKHSQELIDKILAMRIAGMTRTGIAGMLGLTRGVVSGIISRHQQQAMSLADWTQWPGVCLLRCACGTRSGRVLRGT